MGAEVTRLGKVGNFLATPAIAVKNHPGKTLAVFLLVFGLAGAGLGLYSFLSHGVVNAALGQAGSIGLMAGGGALVVTGLAVTSLVGLKIRHDRIAARRGAEEGEEEGEDGASTGTGHSGPVIVEVPEGSDGS